MDLLVVGAGPAGCAAALSARAVCPSSSVLVIDRARFPREKLCAGAITGGGLFELERSGLALRVPHQLVREAVLRLEGRSVEVPLPRPARVVRRLELDADLLDQARAQGVEVVAGCPLTGLEPGGVALAGGERISFRSLICADGASGTTRRCLGLPAGTRIPLREALCSQRGQGALVFDFDAGLAGYAWRFPCLSSGRRVENCGLYAYQRSAELPRLLETWAGREGLSRESEGAWSIRLAHPLGPVGASGALLAGEALGADPLTGEGIRYALWSGRIAGALAARALSRGRPIRLSEYRARLIASRSGVALTLFSGLAARLYGPRAREWRPLASDPKALREIAEIASGLPPFGPLARLALQLMRARAFADRMGR